MRVPGHFDTTFVPPQLVGHSSCASLPNAFLLPRLLLCVFVSRPPGSTTVPPVRHSGQRGRLHRIRRAGDVTTPATRALLSADAVTTWHARRVPAGGRCESEGEGEGGEGGHTPPSPTPTRPASRPIRRPPFQNCTWADSPLELPDQRSATRRRTHLVAKGERRVKKRSEGAQRACHPSHNDPSARIAFLQRSPETFLRYSQLNSQPPP